MDPAAHETLSTTNEPYHPPRPGAEYEVIIYDPRRGPFWEQMLGTRTLPVVSPVPTFAELPGFDEARPVYILDQARMTPEQLERIVQGCAERFQLDPAEVRRDMEDFGCPILADGCRLKTADAGRYLP
jgi:hypothetical protein